ncbi:hypothetical protein EN826_035050, partial [Mesorhizobium sp. M1D.F.Ca.ET.183.01.1.1]
MTTTAAPSLSRQLRFFWAAMVLVIAMLGLLIFRQGGHIFAGGSDKVVPVQTAGTPTAPASAAFD